jgi:Tol biopolymer transport system component
MFGNWSPNGTRFAFLRGQPGDIFIANTDGKDIKQITKTGRVVSEPSWSSDAKRIVYTEINPETGSEILPSSPIAHEHEHDVPIEDVWITEIDGEKPPIRLTNGGDSNSLPYWTK